MKTFYFVGGTIFSSLEKAQYDTNLNFVYGDIKEINMYRQKDFLAVKQDFQIAIKSGFTSEQAAFLAVNL